MPFPSKHNLVYWLPRISDLIADVDMLFLMRSREKDETNGHLEKKDFGFGEGHNTKQYPHGRNT